MGCFSILMWIIFGAIVGAIARLIYPGDEKLNFAGTIFLGVIGSFVGGAINWLLGWGDSLISGSGFIMSIIGAVIACALWVNKSTIRSWIRDKTGM